MGLGTVDDVSDHIHTDRPWLATDPTLAPWPDVADPAVYQPGAWLLPDKRALPAELTAFLDAGGPRLRRIRQRRRTPGFCWRRPCGPCARSVAGWSSPGAGHRSRRSTGHPTAWWSAK
ncbi:hypothetical protein V2I01_30210 [Micromonospora sp. BRA006-A]|nr:hypothetical protein [Micromonospora sp. BRA006-A]